MNLQENILRIKQIMGLLNEQTNGNLLTDKQYDYIKDIEHKFSYISDDKITPGLQYTGRDKEYQIKNTIEKTIGLDYWNKLNAKLKLQIYSFMYQTDSDNNSLYRWLSGLATTIIQYKNEKNPDKNTQIPIMKRSDIFTTTTTITDKDGKETPKILPLDELEKDKRNNIEKAIKIVKEAIDDGTINTINFYNLYLNTIKDQYNNISTGPTTTDKNRKYIWGPRPDALDKLMNGDPWSNVEKWWWDTIDPKKELKENPYKTTGGPIQTATTTKDSAQAQTTGGATSTTPTTKDLAQTQTTGGATSTTTTQTTGGGAATSTNNNDGELNRLVTSGITDTGVGAPFTDKPYISSGNTIYNQRKQSSTLQSNPKLRRPWGDPYIYYSATTGDIYYYLCGKRRDQAGMPVVPCPKLTSSDWIKSDTSTRTNAIKTNIFKN